MASSYVLPASVMTNSHSTHVHSHSQSHSPSRSLHPANNPKSLREQHSNGSLHAHSYSESHLSHIEEHTHNHGHERDTSHFLHASHNATGRSPSPDSFLSQDYKSIPLASYQPPEDHGIHDHDRSGSQNHDHAHDHDHGHGHSHTDSHHHGHSSHDHSDHHHEHSHGSVKSSSSSSFLTSLIIPYTLRWPMIHAIMSEQDSRSIFYFMSLNFSFMLVQATYGYLTDSLGLLSDSIHMFFDCLALAVGLFAAVASKWPATERFPYGFGKIETLAGFGNAIFLILISVEIMTEAVERLVDNRPTKRLMELFVVSSMGLAVNMVGLLAFGHHGHAHGGHDHGHSHSHGESHSHANEHKHDDGCDHNEDSHGLLLSGKSHTGHSHGKHSHSHSHDNENMIGIYLHIMADTLGSAAVVVSTVLIHYTGWDGWDPIASCIIALMIFGSSVPLVKSSANKLLLTVPDDQEYRLREALGGVGELRGVASSSVPRFWLRDNKSESESEDVLGVMHVIATRGSDLDDVKNRARAFVLERGMDVVVQVEKDGDTSCWCGGSAMRSASVSRFS